MIIGVSCCLFPMFSRHNEYLACFEMYCVLYHVSIPVHSMKISLAFYLLDWWLNHLLNLLNWLKLIQNCVSFLITYHNQSQCGIANKKIHKPSLVGGLEQFFFFHILGRIIPFD